jgi:branched-subunit amino acid transport protein
MKDNIRWLVSVILSLLIVWVLFMVDQSLPNFLNRILTYGAAALFAYVLSDIIYSELGKLQSRLARVSVRSRDEDQ